MPVRWIYPVELAQEPWPREAAAEAFGDEREVRLDAG